MPNDDSPAYLNAPSTSTVFVELPEEDGGSEDESMCGSRAQDPQRFGD